MIKIHPWKDIFLQGMLGSDLIAFQSSDYALNFLDCCERGLGTRVDRRLMVVDTDCPDLPAPLSEAPPPPGVPVTLVL